MNSIEDLIENALVKSLLIKLVLIGFLINLLLWLTKAKKVKIIT